jgi:TRAP-type C4-dicarboxylate transport system substrate-binding protein
MRAGSTRCAVLVTAAWYDGLSDKDRAAVDAAVTAANAANRAWLVGASAGALKQLEDLGGEMVRLSKAEREPFRALALKTYDTGLLTPENVKFWAELSAQTR